ncbi:FAD-dependent monooxygenase [Nocardioides insulae]|uniref:FAD-dependent monooxygenase n=1 Tax=Nocardioides insulae TaxID=394734 RepID=UPI0004110408|nr:FAD-dependent monooxygenase [Nocardioides insulae]
MTLHHGLTPLPDETDVLIAGGGPSGLFLALDLAHRGISSVVVEPREELDWLRPRAKTTNARTMTHLRRLGLADRLRAAAPLPVSYSDSVAFCTALTGHELTRFPEAFQLYDGAYPHQPECGQQVAQPVVEQVLRQAAEESDRVSLVLGVSFEAAEGVATGRTRATLRGAGGGVHRISARYLIGADGISSAVRRGLGVRLEGGSASKSNLGLLFRSERLADLVELAPAVQYWVVGRRYAGMVGQMDQDGLWWAIIQGYDADAPAFAGVPRDTILRELIGSPAAGTVDLDVLAEDPWTARMLLSPTYRHGDTFLVGDAAHANPPWGGHGFNTCIGDAANLAWKLAAELRGWAGPDLLDSYEAERRPVARRTIDDAATNGTALADDFIDPALDAEDERGRVARRRAGEALAVKESEFLSLGLVLGYSYPDSPLVTPAGSTAPAPHPVTYVASAAPGCLLPHHWLPDGSALYDLLGDGFTLLVDEQRDLPDAELARVVEAAERVGIPLTVRRVGGADGIGAGEAWEAGLVLVRPDQHVAWRGENAGGLLDALLRATGREVSVRRGSGALTQPVG